MQRFIYLFTYLCFMVSFFSVPQAYAQDEIRTIALFPFTAENAGKYSPLKDGLRTMIAGRLATDSDLKVIELSLSKKERSDFVDTFPSGAVPFFEKYAATHVGAGSITADNERLIIEMSLFTAAGKEPAILAETAMNELGVMVAVDRLLVKIGQELSGQGQQGGTKKVLLTENAGIDAFQTEHPDRKYKQEIVSGSAVFLDEDSSLSRGHIMRRTSGLPHGVISLAVRDADDDGIEEIFVASLSDIRVFRFDRGILQQIDSKKLSDKTVIHSMSLADSDGDGRDELYVSATEEDQLSSFIYSWEQGSGFISRVEKIRMAIRPVNYPDKGIRILGQQKSRKDEIFLDPGIYFLDLDLSEGKLVRGEKAPLPGFVNLFNFAFADIDGNGQKETVIISSDLKLKVLDSFNRAVWMAEQDFGGNTIYLGNRWREGSGQKQGGEVSFDDERYIELQYVPTRILVDDVNNDGREDIIAVQNSLSTFKALGNFRSFKGGSVHCFGWNGQTVATLWQTDVLDGYIADIDFAKNKSLLHDGKVVENTLNEERVRLAVGQIPNDGFAGLFNFAGADAKLVVYEFKIARKSEEK